MKIAIINDTHFGARNDHQLFLDHFLTFFEDVFFPYIKKNNITTVFHLGDLMDRRKFVNFNTLYNVRRRFFDRMKDLADMHMIVGNHDTYYKNTNEVNSAKELFQEYDNFYLYETAQDIILDNTKFCMVPWICEDNKEEVLSCISNSNANILCGHLELNGYEVARGIRHIGGMDDNVFKKFELVLSGHFHNKSTGNNVYYLGTQYQITFSDEGDIKGFHVFDTETMELEFVENKERMFYNISTAEKFSDYSFLKDKYVKLIVNKYSDRAEVDSMIYAIELVNPYDLTVIEDMSVDCSDEDGLDLSKDTITIINEEIDLLELDIDKGNLKKISNEVYLEALNQ